MWKKLYSKIFVMWIILFFIGAGVLPSISGNVKPIVNIQSKEIEMNRFAPLDANLVCWWSFDNENDIGYDDSENGHQGVNHGATWVSHGISGGALNFDGMDDYVEIPDTSDFEFANEPLTYSLWVQIVDNANEYRNFIALGDTVDSGYPNIALTKGRSGHENGRIYAQMYPTTLGGEYAYAYSNDDGDTLPKNEWLFLTSVINYEQSTLKLYVNAEFQESDDLIDFDMAEANSLKLWFGAAPWIGYHGHDPHNSLIDEVRIYDKALSQSEIDELYNQVNKTPVADFTWSPSKPYPGDTITFNASSSYDPDGTIVSYAWDFDDDGQYDDANGRNPTWQWLNVGNYPVSLRVTDNNGSSDIKTKTVYVKNYGYTLYVGGSGEGNYTKIQDAIDNASDDDTIFVYDDSSPYNERITINKVIELIGENKCSTVISGYGISLSASGVTVTGFTIEDNSIYIQSDYNNIYNNNIISYNSFVGMSGISISNSGYNTIYNNSFINCGLDIFPPENLIENYIYNNTVNGKQLVYLYGASNKIFEDVGKVILHYCNNITIKNSIVHNCFIGIQILESENCIISDSYFLDIFMCFFILNSSSITITRNYIATESIINYGAGLFLTNSNYNTISRNNINNLLCNFWLSNSSSNIIKNNNIYYQKRSINIVSTSSVNTWQGNFWNRPRLFPFFIWNFNPPRLIPSLDIDRRPALTPNNIFYINEYKMVENLDIFDSKFLMNNYYWDFFTSFVNYPENNGFIYKFIRFLDRFINK